MSSFRSVTVGVISVPPFVTAYLGLLGYRDLFTSETVIGDASWYVVPLAALGAIVFGAVDRGLTVAPVVTLLAVALVPVLDRLGIVYGVSSFIGFGVANASVAAGGFLVAAAEYALRNREFVVDAVPPRVRLGSLLAGSVHLLFVFEAGVRFEQWDYSLLREFGTVTLIEQVLFLFVVVGLFVVGAVPAMLVARWRFVFPAAFVILLLGWTLIASVSYAEASASAREHSTAPLVAYGVFWFAPFAGTLLVAAVERWLRRAGALPGTGSTP